MDYTQVITDSQIRTTAGLARDIWAEHYIAIIGINQVDYMIDKFQSEDAIADQVQNKGYIYYLIEEKKQAIGYFAVIQEDDALFLSKLYIQKTMRRKGIGRKTIDFIKIIALEKGLGRIRKKGRDPETTTKRGFPSQRRYRNRWGVILS